MPVAPQYAVVCYLAGDLSTFVESLRRELAPEQAHLQAHITLLPPRRLQISEEKAVALIQATAESRAAIPVTIAEKPETFLPVSPTIYLPVAGGDRKSTRLNSSHVSISYAV